jgi:hypothetical protein
MDYLASWMAVEEEGLVQQEYRCNLDKMGY